MSGTGGVDDTIPLQAGKNLQTNNPLQQVGQFANTLGAIQRTKLFPGQMALQQQAIQGGQVGLSQQINQAVNQGLTPLLATPQGGITHKSFTDALGAMEARGIPTGGALNTLLATAPQGDGPAFDQAVRSIVTSQAMKSPESSVAAVTGTPTTIGNGQNIQPGVVPGPGAPGFGGFQPAGGGVPQFPPTSQLMGQVTWTDGQGVTHYGTAAEYATARGIPGAALGPAVAVPGGSGPSLGTGRLPAALRGPNAPAAGAPLSNTSGPEPGVPESAREQVGPAQAIADRVSHFQSDMFPLTQAQQALDKAPTGLGSEALHNASSYINTFAPTMLQKALSFVSPAMSKEEVVAYDEAKKYLTQGQLGAPGATRSNEGLSTAGAASPGVSISKDAAQVVLKGMVALRRMEQDEGQSWIASGQPPSQLNKFRSDFQKQADPRVYMFDQMTPAQRQQTVTSIQDPAKQQAFLAAVQRAENNGVLSAPGAAQ